LKGKASKDPLGEAEETNKNRRRRERKDTDNDKDSDANNSLEFDNNNNNNNNNNDITTDDEGTDNCDSSYNSDCIDVGMTTASRLRLIVLNGQ